jgi:hypothetical protein
MKKRKQSRPLHEKMPCVLSSGRRISHLTRTAWISAVGVTGGSAQEIKIALTVRVPETGIISYVSNCLPLLYSYYTKCELIS